MHPGACRMFPLVSRDETLSRVFFQVTGVRGNRFDCKQTRPLKFAATRHLTRVATRTKQDERAGRSTMRVGMVIRSLMFSVVLLAFSHGAFGQIGISVGFGPPLLPIYEQPILPADGYLWAPGYWGYDYSANDYYWVPGTWVYPPQPGFLWTPGSWGWGGGGGGGGSFCARGV